MVEPLFTRLFLKQYLFFPSVLGSYFYRRIMKNGLQLFIYFLPSSFSFLYSEDNDNLFFLKGHHNWISQQLKWAVTISSKTSSEKKNAPSLMKFSLQNISVKDKRMSMNLKRPISHLRDDVSVLMFLKLFRVLICLRRADL